MSWYQDQKTCPQDQRAMPSAKSTRHQRCAPRIRRPMSRPHTTAVTPALSCMALSTHRANSSPHSARPFTAIRAARTTVSSTPSWYRRTFMAPRMSSARFDVHRHVRRTAGETLPQSDSRRPVRNGLSRHPWLLVFPRPLLFTWGFESVHVSWFCDPLRLTDWTVATVILLLSPLMLATWQVPVKVRVLLEPL